MALNVLELIKGDPFGTNVRYGDYRNYEFIPVTIDGELEKDILNEIKCWEFVCESKSVYDHDDMGKYESSPDYSYTPLLNCGGEFFIHNGRLAGLRREGALYFIPKGTKLGDYCKYTTERVTSRSETYTVEEFGLYKKLPSAVPMYYEALDGNSRGSLIAADPLIKCANVPECTINIQSYAFSNCTDLTSVVIPASVTDIGRFAFDGCVNLKSITVESENHVYHSSGNCLIKTADKTLVWGCDNCEIPCDGSVTTIAYGAFCDRGSIVIPRSVTKIEECAFYGSDVREVYYCGSKSEWDKIQLGGNGDHWFYRYTLYCYSEVPVEGEKLWHYGENKEIIIWDK